MVVARFWVGAGSSVFSTMVGGVVSDLYHSHDRNTPMALFSGGALFGTGLGPLVSGFIAQNTNWRWVFWVQVITCGILITAVTLFFRETRGSILLSRKARALNKWYEELENAGYIGFEMPISPGSERTESQRIRWKVKTDEERESISKMIGISVYRPFHLLITEPVVFFFSLWVAFAWAVLYLTFGSIPLVFGRSHGFNIQESGAVFAAMIVGAILSTVLSIYQDRLLARYLAFASKNIENQSRIRRAIDLSSPEGRLYFACIESAFLPLGLFWFGWTQFSSIPWIVPTMAITCATMGIYSIYLATFNYLADTYHRYASSALAAQSFCRNILGGVFPLVTVQMFNGLTFQGAASLLGGLAALLTAVPWVLVFYGPKIRARSKFASEIM
jgi:MFS family permease